MDGAATPVDPPAVWAEVTSSPVALDAPPTDSLEREALAHCGAGDAGLRDAAQAVIARKLRGLPMPAQDAIALAQRAAGEPHPWARAWAASGRTLAPDATLRKLDEWLDTSAAGHEASVAPLSLRRCGVASGIENDGTRALAVVAVWALADLSPLPTRARTGQWLSLEARLRVHASGGAVVVIEPGGATRRVPSWFDGSALRARFVLDRPGEFTVQVVADVAGGTRPVAEATVFADVDAPARPGPLPAPGEDAVPAGSAEDDALYEMAAAARASSGEPPLVRDRRLDTVAREHARRMAGSRAVAHDAGDGDPAERLRAAGLDAPVVGENVAHAATVALAHRALWNSPSHRANLLRRDFDRVGVAVLRDERGEAWVVESFAGGLR
jgi:uncharacterized protein YkwD